MSNLEFGQSEFPEKYIDAQIIFIIVSLYDLRTCYSRIIKHISKYFCSRAKDVGSSFELFCLFTTLWDADYSGMSKSLDVSHKRCAIAGGYRKLLNLSC